MDRRRFLPPRPWAGTATRWYGAIVAFLTRAPACPRCGGRTCPAGDELLREIPLALETRYRCPRCAEEIVRRNMVDVWS